VFNTEINIVIAKYQRCVVLCKTLTLPYILGLSSSLRTTGKAKIVFWFPEHHTTLTFWKTRTIRKLELVNCLRFDSPNFMYDISKLKKHNRYKYVSRHLNYKDHTISLQFYTFITFEISKKKAQLLGNAQSIEQPYACHF
jgi:hypothetical protein